MRYFHMVASLSLLLIAALVTHVEAYRIGLKNGRGIANSYNNGRYNLLIPKYVVKMQHCGALTDGKSCTMENSDIAGEMLDTIGSSESISGEVRTGHLNNDSIQYNTGVDVDNEHALEEGPLAVNSKEMTMKCYSGASSMCSNNMYESKMSGDLDDANDSDPQAAARQNPLTNLIMNVVYDGGEYSGFVGPNHFFNEEVLKRNASAENLRVAQRREAVEKSVSNEILRALAVIHGYIPGKRKKRKHQRYQQDIYQHDEEDGGVCEGDEDGNDEEYTLPTERRFSLIASSRTDKGVHAIETACQYLSFDREPPLGGNPDHILDNVNRLLPGDIRVTSMIAAPNRDFNVRFDNIGKCYTYKVDISECPNLFERKYYWQLAGDRQFRNTLLRKFSGVRKEFSFERMREAADVIEGTHNFEGFRKKSRGNERGIPKNPICTIERIDIERYDTERDNEKFHVVIKGNRFLYKMVRGIVSHMVLVGYNILKVEQIEMMLKSGEEIPHIQYAPSVGLYLSKVLFEPSVEQELEASKERYKHRLRSILKLPETQSPSGVISS